MDWIVTGGCGFVGTNLTDALLRQGHCVTVIDDLSRHGSESNLTWLRMRHSTHWQFLQGDIRDSSTVSQVIADTLPFAVVHLAGQVAMTSSIADPRRDFEINALGTLNVLEAVRLHSPDTIVLYSSTNKVYGSLESLDYQETDTRYVVPAHPKGFDEAIQLDGHSPYGCSKLAAEQYVRDYNRIYGLKTVVFRHSSMYGGRQFASFDQGWIGWFCQKALEMANGDTVPPFTICGDGKQVRDVLHVDDIVKAYVSAAQGIAQTAGSIYNIGGGMANSLSLLELFSLLEGLTSSTMRYTVTPWRTGDQKVFVADIRKATADFDWQPQVGATSGIKSMLGWSREVMCDQ